MFLKILNFFKFKSQPKIFESEHVKKLINRPKYDFDYDTINMSDFIKKLRVDPYAFENKNLELICDKNVYQSELNLALNNIVVELYFKTYDKYFKGVDLSHINAIKVKFNNNLNSRFFAECRLPKYVDFDFSEVLYISSCLYMSKVQNVRIKGNLINGNVLTHSLWCLDFEERNKNDTFNFEFLVNFKESVKQNLKRGSDLQNTLKEYKSTSWCGYHYVNKFTNINDKDKHILPGSYYIDIMKDYPELLI